ncbi:hypothetical protein EN935_35915, partial [Mesorhizobium sp. M7D.F.Ca.US.004.03.1.1]
VAPPSGQKMTRQPISPLVGEMPGRAEGGAVPPACRHIAMRFPAGCQSPGLKSWRSFAPPSGLPAISPTRGEIDSFGDAPIKRD